MSDNNTLAPCPFCGGDARRSTGGHGSNAWFGTGCGANPSCPAHLRALMHRTQFDADVAWNRRAPAPASQPVAVPGGMEPFAFISEKSALQVLKPHLCLVQHQVFLRRTAQDIGAIALYTAAQVQAMLSAGLAPGWQAVPVEPTLEMERAIAAQFCGTADEVRRAWAEGIAAAPSGQARVPMRPVEAMRMVMEVERTHHFLRGTTNWACAVARAIETAHGITAAPKGSA